MPFVLLMHELDCIFDNWEARKKIEEKKSRREFIGTHHDLTEEQKTRMNHKPLSQKRHCIRE